MRRTVTAGLAALVALAVITPAAAVDYYRGPLIDGHGHLPNATAIDTYVAAMRRHNIRKVMLLGVGGMQPQEAAGMHFQRKPSLAKEKGPLDRGWKALITKMPDRFMVGLDLWVATAS